MSMIKKACSKGPLAREHKHNLMTAFACQEKPKDLRFSQVIQEFEVSVC